MKSLTVDDLQDTEAVEKLCKETDGPVFVTENGCPKFVIMSIEYYEKMRKEFNVTQLPESPV